MGCYDLCYDMFIKRSCFEQIHAASSLLPRFCNLTQECKKVIRLSPVAWQHISLVGKYEFTTNVELPKLETVMAQLISNLNQVVVIIDTKKSLSDKVV